MPTSQREERGQNPGFEKRVLWPSERQQPCSGSESFGPILLPSGFLPPCVRVQFRRYPRGHHCYVVRIFGSSLTYPNSLAFDLVLEADSFCSWSVRLLIRTLELALQMGRDPRSSAT